MSGPIRRFDPSELVVPGEAPPSQAEQADALLAARELEALAAGVIVRPTDGFEDRVMAAIATEPAPRLVVRPPSTVRGGIVASFLLTIRDSWGVATTGGRPIAVRAQALAFVLLVVVTTTALAGAGAIGVGGLLERAQNPPPSTEPAPLPTPSPTPSPRPTVEPPAGESAEPSDTAEPSESAEPSETTEPTETAEPESTEHASTPRPTRSSEPNETPEPDDSSEPSETPNGSNDHSGSGSSNDG